VDSAKLKLNQLPKEAIPIYILENEKSSVEICGLKPKPIKLALV